MAIDALKIAYVIPEFMTEKETGGLARYYDNISRLLADMGHKVTVFVLTEAPDEIIEEYYPGVRVIRVNSDTSRVNKLIPGSFMRYWSYTMNKRLQKQMYESRIFDIVQYANFMALGIDRLNVPTVIRLSSYRPLLREADKEVFNPQKQYQSVKVADYLEDLSVLYADSVYSPSKFIANEVENATGREAEIIESPFYPRHSLVEKKDFVPDGKYILTFGTLKILKGAKLIGDSIFRVLDRCRDLKWVFAGDEYSWTGENGKDVFPSEYIKMSAGVYADRCVFLGKLKTEELFPVIKRARFCVMPSRVDNLPNTCLEAMALGKVVAGTRGASFEQLIEDGENGLLFEREDVDGLLKTIMRADALSEQVIEKMGYNAKKTIERMRPEAVRDQLVSFYTKTIGRYNAKAENYQDKIRDIQIKHNKILLDSGIEDAKGYCL